MPLNVITFGRTISTIDNIHQTPDLGTTILSLEEIAKISETSDT